MEAQELRIGNLVMDNAKVKIVTSGMISNWDIIKRDYGGYKPIPLTEEWLVRFGFILEDLSYMKNIKARMKLVFFDGIISQFSIMQDNKEISFASNQIKEIHQLQNLYFALTGEELTLNETI